MFDFFRKKKNEDEYKDDYRDDEVDEYYDDEYYEDDYYDDTINSNDYYEYNDRPILEESDNKSYDDQKKIVFETSTFTSDLNPTDDGYEVDENSSDFRDVDSVYNGDYSKDTYSTNSDNNADESYVDEPVYFDNTKSSDDSYYAEDVWASDSSYYQADNYNNEIIENDSYYEDEKYYHNEEYFDDNEYYVEEEHSEKLGFFDRIREGLVKTRDQFSSQIKNLFTANVKIDDELFEELEEILISADIGMNSTLDIVDSLRDEIKARSIKDSDQIYPVLKEIMVEKLDEDNLNNNLNIVDNNLAIVLVIGVNGVGKTTTIGKLAHSLRKEGKSVMLAAADTFRAAAIEQLGEWADRAGVEMIAHSEGSDPSAVVFDAVKSAKSKNIDVLIVDTAGRLHNKKNLMKELEKINKTIDTHAGNATRENILVLDATTGQNAVSQLREFKNVTDITGLILTKLDGTAKGGIIFPLQVELDVPVKYIGLGEGIDNLEKFESESFVDALF